MCRLESNNTFDYLLTRSSDGNDLKGLWGFKLVDLDYSKLETYIIISKGA
jgi:hypothetical protein